jgi:hypothetical protein
VTGLYRLLYSSLDASVDFFLFLFSFGRDQTCAMLLALASGNTFLDGVVGPSPGSITSISPETAAHAKQSFYDFGDRPIWAERAMYGTTGVFISSNPLALTQSFNVTPSRK